MAFQEFDGELDAAPGAPAAGFKEFDGQLDEVPKPSLVERLRARFYKPATDAAPVDTTGADPMGTGAAEILDQPNADPRPLLERPATPEMLAMQPKGFSQQEMAEGSVAPWRAKQIADAAAYSNTNRSPALKPFTDSPTGDALRAFDRKPLDNSLFGAITETAGDAGRGISKVLPSLAKSGYGVLQAGAEVTGADSVSSFARAAQDAGADWLIQFDNPNGDSLVTGAFQSLGTAVAGGAVGGTAGAIGLAVGQTAADKYNELRKGGIGLTDSLEGATVHGVAEYLGERIGMKSLARMVDGLASKTGMPPLEALKEALKQQGEEQVTLAIQSAYDKLGSGSLRGDMTLGDYLDDVVTTAQQTAIMTAAAAGGGRIARAATQGAQLLLKPGLAAPQAAPEAPAFAPMTDAANIATAPATQAAPVNLFERAAIKPIRVEDQPTTPMTPEEILSAPVPAQRIDVNSADAVLAQLGLGQPVAPAAPEAANFAPIAPNIVEDPLVVPPPAAAAPEQQATKSSSEAANEPQYKTRTAATVNARRTGGIVAEVPGGFTVAPKPTTGAAQINVQPVGTRGTVAADVQPNAEAPAANTGSGSAAPGPVASAPIAGEKIDDEWTAFTPESGTKGIPRAEMPQIQATHRGPMVNFLNARGITHETVEIPAGELKPTQAEFSPAKVQKAKDFTDTDRSILVSSDGHVLDGHHQWLAKLDSNEPVKAIRLNAPIAELIPQVKEFPSSTQASGATAVRSQPALKAAKPRKKVTTIRGSSVLGAISAQLNGISPTLIADLSRKVQRTRTSKKTGKVTPYTAWDNPLHSGYGQLFRERGTSDLTEIARVLEEDGFIEKGLLERDYLEARAQAEQIVKNELLNGGSTLRQGDAGSVEAEMQRRREMAQDDVPDALFDGLTDADLAESGYADAPQEVKAATERMLADAERAGMDTEALQEDAARITEGKPEDEYHLQLQAAIRQALQAGGQDSAGAGQTDAGAAGPSSEDRSQAAGSQGAESGSEGLTSPTAEGLAAADKRARDAESADRAEQKRLADKASADAQLDEFTLTGSDRPADVAAAAGQKDIFSEPEPAPKVSANKVFTEEAAAAARARLKAKLGRLNSGLDPETVMDGITLAGYHIEKGARTFAAYARAMVADLGEDVKPYLQSWYMATRADPRSAAFKADMDKASAVEDLDIDEVLAKAPDSGPDAAATSAQNDAKESPDVPDADTNLERDRADAGTGDAAVRTPVQGEGSADGAGPARNSAGSARRGRPSDQGVPAGGAAAVRELGDQPVRGGNRADRPAEFDAGTADGERSDDPGFPGVQPELIPATEVAGAAVRRAPDLERRLEQRTADRIAVKAGDLDNIRKTLPYLLPAQQEDVHKAEQRFAKGDGYGMLFTNGTGTGKTFTGLGIVKRFERQGKTNTLIVVPDAKIMSDWVDSGKALGLTITPLADTRDAGRGITITTYANLGENDALATRDWDLVVPDEAHSLKQASDGKDTLALNKMRAITLHPRGALERYSMLNRDEIAERTAIGAQITDNNKQISAADTTEMRRAGLEAENKRLQAQFDKLNTKLEAERKRIAADVAARQGDKRTRMAALSATPFAYETTVDWAEGYLFDYPETPPSSAYNAPTAEQAFMIQNFGWHMKYGKLNQPDAKVDRGLMQRQFNSMLKKAGVLSGRMLDVDADYDRKFILVDSAVGNQIDRAMEFINDQRKAASEKDKDAPNGWDMLQGDLNEALYGKLGHLTRRYLLEAIKAKEVVPLIRQHMKLGRKVVVFHDFKKGGAINPFDFRQRTVPPRNASDVLIAMTDEEYAALGPKIEAYNAAAEQFRQEFPELTGDKLLSDLLSPVDRFVREFPGVLLINGDEKPADLLVRYKRFNDDSEGPSVALVQSAKNKGWSGHDTTGKHPRVLFNLGLPTQPTMTIQQEGRIYRTGQVSNAMFRYLNTGTNWERWAFAQTIADRASAAENLGSGELARALKDAFISGFEESDTYPPGHEGEGTGGKTRDRLANESITEYDRAKTFYFGTQKKNSRTKAQEGTDYFATPEPVGLKMVEWLNLRSGEDALEPSGGHGAIARWFGEKINRTAIEPSDALGSRMAMVFDGKIIRGDFESHNVVNKYDGIAMNPPFGSGGRTAIDHLAKAATHLRDGGRIVALIPTGPAADKKFDKWFYEKSQRPVKPLGTIMLDGKSTPIYKGDTIESRASWAPTGIVVGWRDGNPMLKATAPEFRNTGASMVTAQSIKSVQATGSRSEEYSAAEGLHMVADIKMPSVTFERAGTGVMTRIVVLEKSEQSPQEITRDYTDIESIGDLFDRLESLELKPRAKPVEAEDQAFPAPTPPAKAEKAQARAAGAAQAAETGATVVEHTTAKGKVIKGVIRADLTKEQAQQVDPYTWKKDGGFFIRLEHLAKLNEKFPHAGGQAAFSRKASYSDALAAVLDGTIPESASVQVSEPLPVLEALGLPSLPVSTTGDRLAKMHFDHGLTRSDLKALPELLADPVMVFESATAPGSKVLVLDLWRRGKPVVAAIRSNVRQDRLDVNLLASAYPKDKPDQLGVWFRNGLLRYADKQKTQAWATSGGVQFPWLVQLRLGSDRSVIGPADIGKSALSRSDSLDRRSTSRRVAEVTELVEEIRARWANAPEVVVVEDLSDPRVPESVRAEDTRQQSQGAAGAPEGMYYKGKVYLVASELRGNADVVRVLFHEALGHAGLRGTFGKDLTRILDRLSLVNEAKVRAKALQYGLDFSKPGDRRAAAEEVLAELAQKRPENGLVQSAIAAIRTFLREHIPGFSRMRMTDAEIVRNFILPARAWVERGGTAQPADSPPAFQRVWHGTPHRGIEKFSTEKVGTGEGAQAYGWGLYFASKKEIAEHYRKTLTYRDIVREFRNELPDDADFQDALDAADTISPHRARVIRALAADDWLGFDYPSQAVTAAFNDLDNYDPSPELRDAVHAARGQLYEVEIPEDSDLLLWDRPLSEQPTKVQDALDAFIRERLPKGQIESVEENWQRLTGEKFYKLLGTIDLGNPGGAGDLGDRASSHALAAAGIKGIKYLDSGSRAVGDGSFNYVVFDGADTQIHGAMFSRTSTVGTPNTTNTPAVRQARSPWLDTLGRAQFAPGAWAYSKIAPVITERLLTPLKLNAMPKELRSQLRAMKQQIEQAKEVAVKVAAEGFKLSEADRTLVSDIIEGEMAAGTVPPAHAARMAAGINAIMDQQTNDLVALGMLSRESAERWRGAYLPRFYRSKMMQTLREGGAELWAMAARKAVKKPGVLQGMKGDSLKGRGRWQIVPTAELENWEALGWEVRDPDYQPGLSPELSPDVQVWRDYSREERDRMGEIRDAGFRFTMGYLRTQRDIALGRLFASVAADRTLSARDGRQPDGWVQVPDGSIPGTGGVKRYGKLAGMWVSKEVFNHLENHDQGIGEAMRLYRKALGMWKEGKALALDTPIPTPTGWATMGELQAGDMVFDEAGQPCEVTFATPVQMDRECFEVEFSDGEKIVADAEHLWFTVMRGKPGVRTTVDILNTLKERTRNDNNHSVPVAGALSLPDAELPVPPYVLGAWLGDGHSRGAKITTCAADYAEMIGNLEAHGVIALSQRPDPRSTAIDVQLGFAVNGRRDECLQAKLRDIGVLLNKHIPPIYLRASEAQRRDLFVGLMDTDGTIDSNGKCSFSTSDLRLADDFVELARSLGYKPTRSEKPTQRKLSHTVRFGASTDAEVFRLSRKAARLPAPPTVAPRSQTRQIVAIRPVLSVPVKCIQVSSESRLYLAGRGMIPTHNTVLNPVSHFNNVAGNVSMAHFAGVSYWDAHKYAGAINDLVRNAPMVQEAKAAGLFLGTMTQEELLATMPKELRALASMQASKTEAAADWVWNALSMWLRRPAGKMYEAEDQFFRYLIYRDARKRGMDQSDAVDYSQRYVFAYDDLPKGAKMIRDFGIPFFSYTYKAIPALLHTATHYPHRMAAPAALMWGLNAAMYAIAASEDDEDWFASIMAYINDPARRAKADAIEDDERENLPPWMKGNSSLLGTPKAVRLGINEATQLPMFWDISQIMPGGNMFDVENNAGGIGWPQSMMPSHPLMTSMAAMFWNKDTFFGKDIVDNNDTAGERFEKRADWLWKQFTPAIAIGNYHTERLANVIAQMTGEPVRWLPKDATGVGKDGLPVQPELAALQTIGIKARPIDTDLSEKIDKGQRAKMIRDIDAEMRRLRRLAQKGALSDRNLEAEQDLAREKKQRLREGLTVDGEKR